MKKVRKKQFVGRGFKTEISLRVKDIARVKETRMYNMKQGHIKQIISLIQSSTGDFQVRHWKITDCFIYSSQLVFTVVIVFPKTIFKIL